MQQSYPHLLKQAGYYTGYFGKFGVNVENNAHHKDFDVFDEWGTGAYWKLTGPGWSQHIHITELMGLRAMDFIDKAPSDKPFCLTLGFNAPHAADQQPEQYTT
ncbi:MAG: sulfatase-like hydrolase/transferase [Bacteroidota bacterium]